MEQLQLVRGKIVNSSGHEYMYDNARNKLLNVAMPAIVVRQPPLSFQVREVIADAMTAATATAVTTVAAATVGAASTGATLPPAPTPVTMALTPFIANTSTIVYQSKAGAELWKQSSKGLYGDLEELRYDLSTECCMSFLDDLTNQAKKCSWLVLMQIDVSGKPRACSCSMLTLLSKMPRLFLTMSLILLLTLARSKMILLSITASMIP
jgi:hypothetical protein